MSKPQIHSFSHYILRTPAFAIDSYLNLLNNYSEATLLSQLDNAYIKEALLLASPELYTALCKWQENPTALGNDKQKSLAITLLKYLARMSTRCTPFGLFAGCTVGEISTATNILVDSPNNFTRFTQFDMHFWVGMLQEYTKRKEVRAQLTFYPNNSIYVIGDFYRYIESKFVDKKIEHTIAALRKSDLLDELMLDAKSGTTITQMLSLLADDDSEKEEALDFIHELIDYQFLTSNLDATVTGSNEWDRVLSVIENIPALDKDFVVLKNIRNEFVTLDQNTIADPIIQERIKNDIVALGLTYDEKYLFQTDLNIATTANTLDQNNVRKLQQALYFLNGIQKKITYANSANFIKTFLQRYETRELPLTTVLDTETGIGYIQDGEMNDSHNLLEKFSFGVKTATETIQKWHNTDFVLEKKLQECLANNQSEITLSESDFADFDSNYNQTPATFSVMVEVLKIQEKETIAIESSGNSSAAKLLGRFCNGNPDILEATKQIIEKETAFYHNKILAEIVHIPQSRTGNILRRPTLREYEIPYLSNASVSEDFQINITDLMISIADNRIVLRSKKHNKEVIPCLSNAHNFSSNALPIYQFLCDMQQQDLKPIYGFGWGVLESHYHYFPRVLYKEVILSKAKWIVYKEELTPFLKLENRKLITDFTLFRNKRKIPNQVNWVNGDNTLLLDFDKPICIEMFLKSVQNYSSITLEEFLFSEAAVVQNSEGENFANQFVVSFYKE
jgi:lantibiotic biosynthesis protein